MEGYRLIFGRVIGVNKREPRVVLEVHRDRSDRREEKVVVFYHLFKCSWADEINRTLRDENPVSLIGAVVCCQSCEEFSKKFGVLRRPFDADHIGCYLGVGAAMTDPRPEDFEVGKNGDEIIPISHRFELRSF